MEVCSWDFGAIATSMSGGIVLYIFWQWKKQKRLENLSVLSKETIILLSESLFINTQISIYIEMINNNDYVSNKNIKSLKSEYGKRNDLVMGCYISMLTKFKKDIDSDEIEKLGSLYDMYFNIKSFIDFYDENGNNHTEDLEGFDALIHNCIEILSNYYNYN